MGVLIGWPLYGRQVYAGFTLSLCRMDIPFSTDTTPQDGRTQADCRNMLARRTLDEGYSHLLMLDTDMTYPADTLTKLLDAQKDVICGFAITRCPPHWPVFGEAGPEPYAYLAEWPTDNKRFDGRMLDEVQPTAIAGGAALLVRREVFERIPEPWFSHEAKLRNGDGVGEDAFFCQRCRDAGIEVWCHTGVLCGHITEVTLLPERVSEGGDGRGTWQIRTIGIGELHGGPSDEMIRMNRDGTAPVGITIGARHA